MALIGELEVYNISLSTDSASLMSRLAEMNWKAPDIYYDLRYLRVAGIQETGDIHYAVFTHLGGGVLYPFVLRRVEIRDVIRTTSASDWYDISTPYEYGGPIVVGATVTDRAEIADRFIQEFDRYLSSLHVISEFVRFHPLLSNHEDWVRHYQMETSCDNVIVDLAIPATDRVQSYGQNHRRNIKTARNRGVRITRSNTDKDSMDRFIALYAKTMKRLDAKAMYFFSDQYFQAIRMMNEDLWSLLFAVDSSDSRVSAALFLHGDSFGHYHLGGTDDDAGFLRPNNLLFHEAFDLMKEKGLTLMHLGGAAKSQTGLLAFKGGFSKNRAPYFVGKRILNEKAYRTLSEYTLGHRVGTDPYSKGGFFPTYRDLPL